MVEISNEKQAEKIVNSLDEFDKLIYTDRIVSDLGLRYDFNDIKGKRVYLWSHI